MYNTMSYILINLLCIKMLRTSIGTQPKLYNYVPSQDLTSLKQRKEPECSKLSRCSNHTSWERISKLQNEWTCNELSNLNSLVLACGSKSNALWHITCQMKQFLLNDDHMCFLTATQQVSCIWVGADGYMIHCYISWSYSTIRSHFV